MRVDISVSYAAVDKDWTGGLIIEMFDESKLAQMQYFFLVAHKAACRILLKAFLKSMKTW